MALSRHPKFKSQPEPFDFYDGYTLYQFTDEEYREHVSSEGFFIVHKGMLRMSQTGVFAATTREQLDILIEHLQSLRIAIEPKHKPISPVN